MDRQSRFQGELVGTDFAIIFSKKKEKTSSFVRPQKKKKSTSTSTSSSAPRPLQRSVLVRAVEPPKADAKPGLELAKSGNSFAAVKDIEAIQEILPHR